MQYSPCSLQRKVPTHSSVVAVDAVVVPPTANECEGGNATVSWIKAESTGDSGDAGTRLSSNHASSVSNSETTGAVHASPVNEATRLATL